jgi:hypothetical protein
MFEKITNDEFHTRIRAQGAPSREDIAFECVMCRTVQSARSLIAAGAGKDFDEVEKFLGFSCVGRWTNAGSHKRGNAPGKGCDWTLGGFLTIHDLEVVDESGDAHPRFALATPEATLVLASSFANA